MIASQRRAHFLIWRVLAPLTLIGLIVAITLRPARLEQGPVAGAAAAPGARP